MKFSNDIWHDTLGGNCPHSPITMKFDVVALTLNMQRIYRKNTRGTGNYKEKHLDWLFVQTLWLHVSICTPALRPFSTSWSTLQGFSSFQTAWIMFWIHLHSLGWSKMSWHRLIAFADQFIVSENNIKSSAHSRWPTIVSPMQIPISDIRYCSRSATYFRNRRPLQPPPWFTAI